MRIYHLRRPHPERHVPMEIGTCDQILRLLSEIMECHPDRTADLMRRADSVLDERLRLMREREFSTLNP